MFKLRLAINYFADMFSNFGEKNYKITNKSKTQKYCTPKDNINHNDQYFICKTRWIITSEIVIEYKVKVGGRGTCSALPA